jgi:hypothetical protein
MIVIHIDGDMSRVTDRLGFIEPQLPTLTDRPPGAGTGFTGQARWLPHYPRSGAQPSTGLYPLGLDWSDRYPGILSAASSLDCRSAILDGEVVVQDERGVSDFEALRCAGLKDLIANDVVRRCLRSCIKWTSVRQACIEPLERTKPLAQTRFYIGAY